nr:hypothetical protein [Tanacetum cinerariifolium]
MIPETDLHCFDVHNDGYSSNLPLAYVNGVILEMALRRMPYEQFVKYLEEKSGNYFQGLYYQVPNQDLERGLARVSDDRMKANRKAKAKEKENPFLEMSEPNDENSMHTDSVRGENFKEHDIYMNELLKSLKTADKNGITKDPFIFVEKHVESYPMSYKARVVAKYGQRPPRLSDPKKDKQRKHTRYLSSSIDELPTCLWRCYARWMTDEKTFQCISLEDEHTCVRNFNYGSLVNYKWIAKLFGDKIRANPDIRLCNIDNLVMKKYKCKVTPNQCINDKKYALTKYEKTFGEHYVMLRSYGNAILNSNPRSIVKLGVAANPDDKTSFDRDEYNHIYPVAWVVVNVKNKDNWTWFLELLLEDLDSSRGNGLTLMSDQHKGLMEAVKDVMQNAEHRQCARHIYENFRKQSLGLEFRQVDRGCEAIENGFSECFNIMIVSVRHKPLLTMLEAIRVIVLERMNKIRETSRKWNPEVCLNIKKRLEWPKEQQRFWHVIPAGENLFEIRRRSEGFTVDEGKRTCSCRMWQVIRNTLCSCHKVPDMNFWPDQSMYFIVLPSKPRKMHGRPRKKRIRAIGEGGSSTRVSKVGSQESCSNCKILRHNKASGKEPVVKQTPKPKKMPRRPRKKQSVGDLEDVDVVLRGPVRDEGVGGSRGDVSGSRGKGGVGGSRGGAGRGGAGGSRGGAGRFRGGASGSKRKPVSSAETQKRQGKKKVGTSGFAKWFGLQDEPE